MKKYLVSAMALLAAGVLIKQLKKAGNQPVAAPEHSESVVS